MRIILSWSIQGALVFVNTYMLNLGIVNPKSKALTCVLGFLGNTNFLGAAHSKALSFSPGPYSPLDKRPRLRCKQEAFTAAEGNPAPPPSYPILRAFPSSGWCPICSISDLGLSARPYIYMMLLLSFAVLLRCRRCGALYTR